jgi:hypothetical protein
MFPAAVQQITTLVARVIAGPVGFRQIRSLARGVLRKASPNG